MEEKTVKPVILHAHRTLCPPDWSWDSRQNKWDGFHLWFIAKGEGKAIYRKIEYKLKPGSCFLLRMWEPFLGSQDVANPLLVCAANFNYFDENNKSLAKELKNFPGRYREIPNVVFFQELVENCVARFNNGNNEDALVWLNAALSEIRKTDAMFEIKDSFKKDYIIVNKLCSEVESAPEKSFKIEELAKNSGYSTDHFIRVFKKLKGSTPKNYIINAKISAAKNMLLFSSFSVKEIADKLSYNDVYSFSKQFRKFSGKSPNRYRKRT